MPRPSRRRGCERLLGHGRRKRDAACETVVAGALRPSHRNADASATTLSGRALLTGRTRAKAVGALSIRPALGIGDTRAARALDAGLPATTLRVRRARTAGSVDTGEALGNSPGELRRPLVAVGVRRARTANASDARLPVAAVGGVSAVAAEAHPFPAALPRLTLGGDNTDAVPPLAAARGTWPTLTVRRAGTADAGRQARFLRPRAGVSPSAYPAQLTIAVRVAGGDTDAGHAGIARCTVVVHRARTLKRRVSAAALGGWTALTVRRADAAGPRHADLTGLTLTVPRTSSAADLVARHAGHVGFAHAVGCIAIAPALAVGVRGAIPASPRSFCGALGGESILAGLFQPDANRRR
jgi:hypothetical protein